MTGVFVVVCVFDTGVVLIELTAVFGVLISLLLAVKVFALLVVVLVVLVSDAVFLLSLCLVVLQEMNTDSTSTYQAIEVWWCNGWYFEC